MATTYKEGWAKLSPENKRKLVMVGAAVTIGATAWALVSLTSGNDAPTRKKERPVTRELFTGRDPRSLGMEGLKAELEQVRKQMREMTNPSNYPQAAVPQQQPAGGDAQQQTGEPADMTPEDRAALDRIRNAPPAAQGAAARPPAGGPRTNSATPPVQGDTGNSNNGSQFDRQPAPEPLKIDIKTFGEKEEEGSKVVKTDSEGNQIETIKGGKNAKNARFTLPAGSIMEGVLITGMDTPTANHARQQPFPVLVRIKHEALLPNRWRTDIRECFVIASGYGDLASERAYLRAEAISCVRDDGSIMESQIDAFAAGEDGKNGIRGRLVSKQGQMIAQSLMGGFIQGVAGIYKPAKVPQLNLSGGSAYSRPDPEVAVEEGVAGGIQAAGKAVADFYIDMAKNTFPIIEIDAGRKVTFIVSRSANVTTRQASADQSAKPIGGSVANNLRNSPIGQGVNRVINGSSQYTNQ